MTRAVVTDEHPTVSSHGTVLRFAELLLHLCGNKSGRDQEDLRPSAHLWGARRARTAAAAASVASGRCRPLSLGAPAPAAQSRARGRARAETRARQAPRRWSPARPARARRPCCAWPTRSPSSGWSPTRSRSPRRRPVRGAAPPPRRHALHAASRTRVCALGACCAPKHPNRQDCCHVLGACWHPLMRVQAYVGPCSCLRPDLTDLKEATACMEQAVPRRRARGARQTAGKEASSAERRQACRRAGGGCSRR